MSVWTEAHLNYFNTIKKESKKTVRSRKDVVTAPRLLSIWAGVVHHDLIPPPLFQDAPGLVLGVLFFVTEGSSNL